MHSWSMGAPFFGKEELSALITGLGFPETVRGEMLSLEAFARLADAVSEAQNSSGFLP